jgi:transcriptional regulator with XRE-family HTH domain
MTSFTADWLISMEFAARLTQLRKQKALSQQALADAVGIHVAQVKRYEAGTNQPSLEVLKKIATTFGVSADFLLFDEEERGPGVDFRLQFDVINHLDEDEQRIIRELIDGMILKYQARRWSAQPPPPTREDRASGQQALPHS